MQIHSMAEKRRLRRHRLATEICVYDSFSHFQLGRLANIHQEGLMIVGKLLPIHATYQIQLRLPHSINQQTTIELGIESLWANEVDNDHALFWVGCSIIDKSPLANACLNKLIALQCEDS